MRCTFRKPLKFKGAYIGTDEERNAYEIIAAFTVAGHKQENNILSSFTQGLVSWSVFVRKNSREHFRTLLVLVPAFKYLLRPIILRMVMHLTH